MDERYPNYRQKRSRDSRTVRGKEWGRVCVWMRLVQRNNLGESQL